MKPPFREFDAVFSSYAILFPLGNFSRFSILFLFPKNFSQKVEIGG